MEPGGLRGEDWLVIEKTELEPLDKPEKKRDPVMIRFLWAQRKSPKPISAVVFSTRLLVKGCKKLQTLKMKDGRVTLTLEWSPLSSLQMLGNRAEMNRLPVHL